MNQMSTCQHSLDHRQSKGIPESIYFCFIDYGQAFDYVDPTNWKILKEMGIPDDCTCLLWKPVCRSRSDSYNWTWNFDRFKFGKGVMSRLYIVTCLFNLHAKYIMINAWLDEAQAGIKIGGRNISNFKYADDTSLIVETEEELKSLLMSVKEESEKEESVKPTLKLKIQKTKWTKKKSYFFFFFFWVLDCQEKYQ